MSEKLGNNAPNKMKIKIEGNLQLTEQERKTLEDLTLEENKNEVREMILTREELKKLRRILSEKPKNKKALKEFFNKQEKETASVSEIMKGSSTAEKVGGIEKFKDISDLINETLYKHFFQNNESAFSQMDISEDAKRNFSTGANFFFMNFITEKQLASKNGIINFAKKTGEIMGDNSNPSFLDKVVMKGRIENETKDNINPVIEMSNIMLTFVTGDLGKIISQAYKPEKENLLKEVFSDIKTEDRGERDPIFMNPLETYKLMNFVYNESHSKEEIKNYIQNIRTTKNIEFSEEDKKELQKIGDKVGDIFPVETLQSLGKWSEIKGQLIETKDKIKESIVNNKEIASTLGFLTSIPILGDFIKTILEFIGIKDLDKLLSGKDFEASKKAISENINGKGSIFEGKKIDQNTFMKINGNDDSSFLNDMTSIIGEKEGEDFGTEVQKLFKNGGGFDTFRKNEKTGIKFEGDSINYEELKKAISLFREYKAAKEKDKNLSVESFMEQKEKEKKANQNTINRALALATAGSGVKQESSIEKPATKQAKGEASKTSKNTDKNSTTVPQGKTVVRKDTTDIQAIPTGENRKKSPKTEKQPVATSTTETENKKPNPELFINESEGLEINGNNITAVFETNGTKYKLQLLEGKSKKGNLIITGGGEAKVFEGGADISSYLSKNFGNKLDKTANGKDFGEFNVNLGDTIKNILLNGFNGFGKSKPGLSQLFAENFFTNGKLKDTATITFREHSYHFEKVNS